MSIFSNITKSREKDDKNKALDIMLDFANGKISTEDFWEQFKSNEVIRETLIKDKTRPPYRHESDPGNFFKREEIKWTYELDELYYFDPSKLLERIDITRLQDRDALFWITRTYFVRRKKKLLDVKNKDAELNRIIHAEQKN